WPPEPTSSGDRGPGFAWGPPVPPPAPPDGPPTLPADPPAPPADRSGPPPPPAGPSDPRFGFPPPQPPVPPAARLSLPWVGAAVPQQGAGSGFVLSPDGVIVTNNHVVDGATTITVTLADGRKLPARVLGRDATADLAVVKVDAGGLPAVKIGRSDALVVGDSVV